MKLILTPEDVECAIRKYVKEKVILPDNAKISFIKDNAVIEWTYEVSSNNSPPQFTPRESSYSGGSIQPNGYIQTGGYIQTDIHYDNYNN